MTKQQFVPTSAELALLKVLWQLEPATVRQVHEHINKTQKAGYTTVLKMFQIMHEKGLVARDDSSRAHIYTAIYSEQQTQSSMVKDLIKKVFSGSKYSLVVRALGEQASNKEINEIRDFLNELEQKNKQ